MHHIEGFKLHTEEIYAPLPVLEMLKCKYCGFCAVYCPGQAIRFDRYRPSVSIVVSRCLACGECIKACNRQVIKLVDKLTGYITQGRNEHQFVMVGQLDGTRNFQVPLIRSLVDKLNRDAEVICDFGPGNSEIIHLALKEMDKAAIVVKPSPGWERNLGFIRQMAESCRVPSGVILNKIRYEHGFIDEASSYCSKFSLPLLGIIPYDNDLGKGRLYDQSSKAEKLENEFSNITDKLAKMNPVSLNNIK